MKIHNDKYLYLVPELLDLVDVLEPLGVGIEEYDGLQAGELSVVHLDAGERGH